jgi:uncharacterized damage-inducible protein DinB
MNPQASFADPQSVEPWLRGPIPDVHPSLAPVLHSFAQVREELALYTSGLPSDAVWRRLGAVPSLGFQLRHIAGSVERLVTYLSGEQLSPEQIGALKSESVSGAPLEELLAIVNASLEDASTRVRSINPASLYDARFVGKKRLPTTVIGLLVHVAEHTQRHLGQAITTTKLLREAGS